MLPEPPPTAARRPAFVRRVIAAAVGSRLRVVVSLTALAALATGASFAAVYLVREARLRKVQAASERWALLQVHAAKQDVPAVRDDLAAIANLTPGDPNIDRWQTALSGGPADPTDLGMVRFAMNEHLRAGRLADAAREAAVRVSALPKDWQARCVLAHAALEREDRAAAAEHLEALPSPFDIDRNPGPGPLLYAIRLNHQLGLSRPELTSYVVLDILPALEAPEVTRIPLAERLQLLDAFGHAGTALDANPDVARYWVPAAALGRNCVDDPAATSPDFVRLGYLFEDQLTLLAELRRRERLPPADAARLRQELEDRLRTTWQTVVDRDPKEPAGHIGLALADHRAGRTDDAVATLGRGLAACGDRVELIAAFADLTRRRDPQAGLDLLVRAVRQRPDEPRLWRLTAETASAANRPDLALAATDEVLRRRPGDPWACRFRGGVLLTQGRATEAAAALEPIRPTLAADAAAAEIYVAALCASGATSLVDPLLAEFANKPTPVPGLTGGSRALFRAGRPDQAAAWAAEAVRVAPDDRPARLLHADSLRAWAELDGAPAWNQDRVTAAVRAYEWLRDRTPDDVAVANNLAWLILKGQRLPATADVAAAPLRAREGDGRSLPAEMLETLGAIDLEIGEPERAARLLERATRSPAPRAGFWIHLGRAYLALGRRADAKRCLDRAAELPRSVREADELAGAVRAWGTAAKPAAR
jgi:tetratricopeptide (TPR) repeat protein